MSGIDDLSRYRVQVEMTYVDVSAADPAEATVYLSNFDLGEGGPYRAVLANSVSIDQRLDSVGFGSIKVLRQPDMDAWLSYAWKGHEIKIYVYPPGSSTRSNWFFGYNGGITSSGLDHIEWSLQDRKGFLDRPLLTGKALDASGKELTLPLLLGDAYNVPAVYINNQYYYDTYKPQQVELVNVKDNGITIQSNPTNSVFEGGNTLFVTGNGVKKYNKSGWVQPVEQLFGTLTVDVRDRSTRTALQKIEYLADLAGFSADPESLQNANQYEYGGFWFTDSELSIRAALDKVCADSMLFWRTDDFQDIIYAGRIALPNTHEPVTADLKADDIIHNSLRLVENRPPVAGYNYYSGRNYHPFDTGDIAADVSDADKTLLTKEWTQYVAVENPNGEHFPNSEWVDVFHNHIGDFFSGHRIRTRAHTSYIYELKTTTLVQVGDHIGITYPQDSFETGRTARVVGVKRFVDSPIYDIKIWVGAEVTGDITVDTRVSSHLVLKWFVDQSSVTCRAINSVTITDQSGGFASSTEAGGEVNNVAMPVAGHSGITFPTSSAGPITFRHNKAYRVTELVVNGTDYRATLSANGEWPLIFETEGTAGGYDEVTQDFVAGYDSAGDADNPYQVVLNVDNSATLPGITSITICALVDTLEVTSNLDIRWDVAASTLDYETVLTALAPIHRWKLDDGGGGGGGGNVIAGLTPFAFWKLGEASGTTANDELGNNHGTYIGSPTLGETSLNLSTADTSVTIDGNTQRVEITAFDPASTSYSLTFLMSLDVDWLAESADRYFMSFITADFNGFRVYYHNSSKGLRIDIGTGGSYTTIAVADYFTPKQGKTYSVTITVTPTTVNVYIDGQLFGTGGGVTTTWAGSSYAFMLGSIYFAQSRFFVGQLDEVAFFDKELTAQNALDIYNEAINNSPDGQLASVTALSPVGYYPMQETSGTTATDEGPNSLNGTYNTGVTIGLPGHRFTAKAQYFSPSNGGGAMSLSGSRTHLEFAGSFSISFIFRGRGAGSGLRRFVSVGGVNGYTAQLQFSQLRLRVANGEMQTQITYDDHHWHHVVMVYTGGDGNGKIYVDGVDRTWFDSTNPTPNYTDPETTIGVSSLPLYCDLSHFAFYGAALTAQNALDLYNGSGV